MNQERAPHHFGRGYMMQVLLHVGMSAVFTGVVECFLVFNISSYTSYLYQMGNDHPLVQSFAFAGLVSILRSLSFFSREEQQGILRLWHRR